MKDFAKSIRVGNAYTKGQVLGEEAGKKYVFGGEINGTYIVHRQPDGKTFSFSSEQEIKDWMRNSKIGNSKAFNKSIVLKDGNVWVVLYANETKSQEFKTEAEAREFAKKVGNRSKEQIQSELNKLYNEKEEYFQDRETPPSWLLSKIEKLEKELKEAERKTGNDGFYLRDPDPTGKLEGEARARLRKGQWQEIYKHFMQASQSELSKIKTKQDAINFLVKKGENANDVAVVEAVKKFIGNESIYKQEASMFEGLKKDAEKEIENETPEEMEVKYKGYTITYFPYQKKYMVRHPNEVSGLMQKHFTSVDEAKKAIDKKVGNAKVDWSKVTDKYIDKNGHEVVIQKKEDGYYITNLRNGKEIFAPDRYSAIGIMEKNGSRVENEETKAERKFGKVMGEFEEGALKTPQGKTVTDPAQAKAIAYSEADKVDNLKRARNAMNKKVKNSSVREYKDREGRIAVIDFNSDGTDADMSIYEDERTTRSVESKNFSTIRDAEQYVQSHGFRRVG